MIRISLPLIRRNDFKWAHSGDYPFLDMKMSWYTKGDLQFVIFRNKVQKLKYAGIVSIHTTSTLCTISSGVINRLEKLTLCTPGFHSNRVDLVHPDNSNDFSEVGLAPSTFLKMGEWCKYQYEKWIMTRKMTPLPTKRKTEMSIFVLITHVIYLRPYTGW